MSDMTEKESLDHQQEPDMADDLEPNAFSTTITAMVSIRRQITCLEREIELTTAALLRNQESEQRAAFNAGYCYGVEEDASPEELDVAWEMHQRRGEA